MNTELTDEEDAFMTYCNERDITWPGTKSPEYECWKTLNSEARKEKPAQAEKQEPVKDEPVAYVDRYTGSLRDRAVLIWTNKQLPAGTKLYTRPQPDLTAEVERLRQICRDTYEVWAGSNGIPEPITCAEAYLLQLLIQMRDEVKRGLK